MITINLALLSVGGLDYDRDYEKHKKMMERFHAIRVEEEED